MKVNHSFLFLPLLLSLTTALSAQENSKIPYEDIYLKDGSVYHGYIAEQTVATGQVVIEYIWADYTFDGDKVLLSQFDDPVTSLIADGKAYSNVKVLETGDLVTFRVLNGGTFQVKSSEIVKTERPVYEGIYDLVTLRNTQQQHKGHIIETVPGKSIKLVTDNGKVINLLQKNIALQQRECKNKEKFNIVMQSPFSEEYVMKNGNVFKGVLVTQDNSSGLLTLSDNKGNPVAFLLKDIQIIRKVARPDFTIVSPKLGENVVRVNGTEYTGITPKQEKSNLLVPADEHLPFILVEPGKLTVDADRCIKCGKCVDSCRKGAMTGKNGYLLTFGGTFGSVVSPGRSATPIVFDKTTLFRVVDAAIDYFERYAEPKERLASTIKRRGWDEFQETVRGAFEAGEAARDGTGNSAKNRL